MDEMDSSRSDGRRNDEVRSIVLKTHTLSHPSGSASIEFGKTKVLAAVYGPQSSERKQSYSEKCTISCEIQGSDKSMKEFGRLVKSLFETIVCIERYPNTSIELRGVILAEDGSHFAAMINAFSVAIADAGIEMFDFLTACHLAVVFGQSFIDPTKTEIEDSEFEVMVVSKNDSRELCHLSIVGSPDFEQIRPAIDQCLNGCAAIKNTIRTSYN